VEEDQHVVRLGLIVATPPAVLARDLYRFYRAGDEEVLALRGVSLRVAAGEMVVVAGPSGSGKSTLLALLAGLDEPDGGFVTLVGERMSHRAEVHRTRLRRGLVGILRQSGNLVDHLSVRENVELVRRLRNRSARGRPVDELLDRVALGPRAQALPRELSGGELARAGLAVALVGDPAVLVADEPTGELDLSSERRVLALVHEVAAAGTAVVIASHSTEVASAADRVLQLADGRWADQPERTAA
jgi:putative ABC transport system ATP-binding protein